MSRSCAIATDGTPVYSRPSIGDSTVTLNITKAAGQYGVAVVCNTDWRLPGRRHPHQTSRLPLAAVEGVSARAMPTPNTITTSTLDYDWNAVSHPDTSSTLQHVTPVTPKTRLPSWCIRPAAYSVQLCAGALVALTRSHQECAGSHLWWPACWVAVSICMDRC